MRRSKVQGHGKKTQAPNKPNNALSKGLKAHAPEGENMKGLDSSTKRNDKRKRNKDLSSPDDHVGAGAGRPGTDEHEDARPNKPPKRAKPSPDEDTRPLSKTKTTIAKKGSQKPGQRINYPPNAPLDVFVFGEGACGELGLGSKAINEDEYDELNPAESAPGLVDISGLDTNIRWAQVVASDNASFALADNGRVYGWGTFRSNEGIMGFVKRLQVQKTPILIPDLKDIRKLAAGNNHVLALNGKGKVFAWGCGEQNQLGRRVFANHPELALRPTSIGALPLRGAKAAKVACGSYHSFAVDMQGRVYAWGLNTYAELAIPDEAGESNAYHLKPRLVESLRDYKIVNIAGGEHHSLASTDDGKLLTWGRMDGDQVGLRAEAFTPENTLFDERGNPRILKNPTVVPDLPPIASIAAGTDHSFALTASGETYSWGFSSNGRTGQGTEDDIKVPTLIDSKAVRGKKLTVAGAGGSFSILACVAV
ncbi:hypothetical protein Daus18300_008534 [Diaporthe australafricana]|uniref:RCC1-like domain-containing protein n=1 Tax=Diaporthe australafricana TaxID=127596 RepID=A0ABR3WI57_9PEZI